MKKPSEPRDRPSRESVIGLGGRSMRKSYFAPLQERLDDLARFRALLDAASDAVAVIELPSLHVVDANRSAQEWLRWRAGEELELGGRDGASWSALRERLTGAQGADERVTAVLGEGDAQRTLDISTRQEVHGTQRYAVVVARDVTERKRAADELQRAKERAEAGERARSEFLSVAAHELRTPVAGVLLTLQHAARRLGRGEPVTAGTLERLVRQAERLGTLVNDLLDVSRLEHSRFPLRLARVEIVELVQEAVEELRPRAAGRPIRIAGPPALHVRGDPVRIAQVLSNLLENAVKYSPPGAPVDVGVRQEGSMCEIAVTDRGLGLSEEEQRRLFTPFLRMRHAEEREPGLGLGLHISKRLAELQGGRLEVRSAKGHGATFTLALPVE
jgi:two-component system CheB/CheR fusion protein